MCFLPMEDAIPSRAHAPSIHTGSVEKGAQRSGRAGQGEWTLSTGQRRSCLVGKVACKRDVKEGWK